MKNNINEILSKCYLHLWEWRVAHSLLTGILRHLTIYFLNSKYDRIPHKVSHTCCPYWCRNSQISCLKIIATFLVFPEYGNFCVHHSKTSRNLTQVTDWSGELALGCVLIPTEKKEHLTFTAFLPCSRHLVLMIALNFLQQTYEVCTTFTDDSLRSREVKWHLIRCHRFW